MEKGTISVWKMAKWETVSAQLKASLFRKVLWIHFPGKVTLASAGIPLNTYSTCFLTPFGALIIVKGLHSEKSF